MALITTKSKDKLPKGFSYPLGAEALSAALEGIPQYESAVFWFRWRGAEFLSRWRKRLERREPIPMFHVVYSEYFGQWNINVYSVPSEHAVFARESLRAELPTVRAKLLLPKPAKSILVTLSLQEAEKMRKNSPVS